MVSLDPIIERGYGYPLLYQSGEAFHGQPLHDRQHPHDFFSELAATYSYKLDEKNSVFIYAGYPASRPWARCLSAPPVGREQSGRRRSAIIGRTLRTLLSGSDGGIHSRQIQDSRRAPLKAASRTKTAGNSIRQS